MEGGKIAPRLSTPYPRSTEIARNVNPVPVYVEEFCYLGVVGRMWVDTAGRRGIVAARLTESQAILNFVCLIRNLCHLIALFGTIGAGCRVSLL